MACVRNKMTFFNKSTQGLFLENGLCVTTHMSSRKRILSYENTFDYSSIDFFVAIGNFVKLRVHKIFHV